MIGLVEDETQALRVVKLALDVDLMLGARLAGEVRKEFQEKTIRLIWGLDIPQSLKIELLGMTRSEFARSPLFQILNSGYFDHIYILAEALANVGHDDEMSKCMELEDKLHSEMNQAAYYEDWDNQILRESIASDLENVDSSDVAVLNVVKLLNDEKLVNKGSDKFLKPRNHQAKKVLGEETFNQCLSLLLRSLNNDNIKVRYRAALALININSDVKVIDIIQAIEDENYLVRCNAVIELGKFSNNKAVIPLIKALTDKNPLVRSKAAEVLAKFHRNDVTYALIQALNDKFSIVRSNAVKSLGNMNCEQVLKYLINYFKDEDSNTRHIAVTAIVNFTQDSNNKQLVINYLISALIDEESSISAGAGYTLKKIAHFSEEQSKYDLIESVLNKESPIESFPTQIGEIIEYEFLPQMQNLLLIAKNEMKDLILDVQTKYKYYNHEIFYSPPIEEKQKNRKTIKTVNIAFKLR